MHSSSIVESQESLITDTFITNSGFGTRMADAQMVIVWPNSDGSATLSQRTASGETMPTLDSSPDRVATLQSDATDVTGASSDGTPKFSFTVEVS